ncbi:fatty acid oxidation complex subunit alpha FadB [Spongorhabdus nitratireducens]
MIYEGQAITVQLLDDGIAQLEFNLKGESVNKLSTHVIDELNSAVAAVRARVESNADVKGLVVTSGKPVFIVGADITEFLGLFSAEDEVLFEKTMQAHSVFNALEDLPVPTVCAINGLALGGGFETALSCDYRVMSTAAKVGLPEVKLGIYPGWGGTVRLSRLIGPDNAAEWICAGGEQRPDAALKVGAVDAVVTPEKLLEGAVDLAKRAASGELDYKAKRQEKLDPLKLNQMEQMMAFTSAIGFVGGKAGPNYPAPVAAIKAMQKHANKKRDDALAIEAKGFVKVAKSPVARNLVGLFLNDQALKKTAKAYEKDAAEINKAAVLGAGIMGGGISYQSAIKGTPVVMKDINQAGIDLGLGEASKLLTKRVAKKKMEPAKMGEVLNRIEPALTYAEFENVDVVVEAVVENVKVKHAVLAEAEKAVKQGTVIASNTSTISISRLAEALDRPEDFCGMHFFNPVHMMPLVEVIRGEKTSEKTIATVVNYAKAMGKSPIVVNDCPGFLVNRVLFPYFGGFAGLLRDGADFQQVDKVMERFGWPMGPAYLLDVVGMDTGEHANKVMAEGFPDRMQADFKSGMEVMVEHKRFGQKNGVGFYRYETDKKGKPKKIVDESSYELLAPVCAERKEFDQEEIIARMMIPMCLELVRCMEDNIVATPAEADMGLIFGVGFPPFRGGGLRYIDEMGVQAFVDLCDKYADLGPLYQPTEGLRKMAAEGKTFY